MANTKTKKEQTATVKSSAPDPEVLTDIEININDLIEKYINSLNDPEEIYNNNGSFVGMLKYIYKYYLSILLGNKNRVPANGYDYILLDDLFNIYTDLVYRYKKNKQPNIIEYCLFTNIDRTMLYRIRQGEVKKATFSDIHNVKRWFSECENSLLNNDSVSSIFKLKAMFNYNDNLAPVPIELQSQALSINQLPDLTKNDPKQLPPGDKEQTEKARKS